MVCCVGPDFVYEQCECSLSLYLFPQLLFTVECGLFLPVFVLPGISILPGI